MIRMNVDHPLNFLLFIIHIEMENTKGKEVVAPGEKGKEIMPPLEKGKEVAPPMEVAPSTPKDVGTDEKVLL